LAGEELDLAIVVYDGLVREVRARRPPGCRVKVEIIDLDYLEEDEEARADYLRAGLVVEQEGGLVPSEEAYPHKLYG
jgi:hypothetical protein